MNKFLKSRIRESYDIFVELGCNENSYEDYENDFRRDIDGGERENGSRDAQTASPAANRLKHLTNKMCGIGGWRGIKWRGRLDAFKWPSPFGGPLSSAQWHGPLVSAALRPELQPATRHP